MSSLVTTQTRLRGHGNAARSAVIRQRVKDILGGQLGGRNGPKADENARETFIRAAVRLSLVMGRTWSDRTFPLEVGAMSSLKVLLEEKKLPVKGRIYTGVNDAWVLDIWDETCNYFAQSPAFSSLVAATETFEKCTDAEVAALNSGGPKVIAEPVEKKTLAMSVLEAYIERNDERMMKLIVDLDGFMIAK